MSATNKKAQKAASRKLSFGSRMARSEWELVAYLAVRRVCASMSTFRVEDVWQRIPAQFAPAERRRMGRVLLSAQSDGLCVSEPVRCWSTKRSGLTTQWRSLMTPEGKKSRPQGPPQDDHYHVRIDQILGQVSEIAKMMKSALARLKKYAEGERGKFKGAGARRRTKPPSSPQS